ncbi:MAG: prepilin-type N-terminal cleavage/methylation domain-containing protein [Acidobacteria bacterium]|nr:prepilin-type N-terminal cleavage/methylation domain-containing protein [Acidobacteriota bacterium]
MKRQRLRRGFTLLEVLVATTIMAIAVVTLLSALTTSLRNAGTVSDSDKASMLAKQTMDTLLAEPALAGAAQGQFRPDVTGLNGGWRARVEPFDAQPNVRARVERIVLEVWWERGFSRRTLQLEGFRRTVTPGLQ